jgi:predicted DsbA family dithiol-disulfide isomerase
VHEFAATNSGVDIVWRAFELRPDPVPTLDPSGAYLHRVWGSSVYPMAERLGMTIRLPPLQPRSRLAHEAAHWARSQARFDDYNAAVFRAFFERGEDIGDIAVLTALAAQLGLSADALRRALENHAFLQSVLDDERLAQTLGISGVPAFVANRKAALSGIQPVTALKALVSHVSGK